MPMKIRCIEGGCLRLRGLADGPVCAPGQCLECAPYKGPATTALVKAPRRPRRQNLSIRPMSLVELVVGGFARWVASRLCACGRGLVRERACMGRQCSLCCDACACDRRRGDRLN